MASDLSNRMKQCYEDKTRYYLPQRTYTICRIDGKAFHRFTKQRDFERPFSDEFMGLMDATARALCGEIDGARLAYVQSDEISLLLTDFQNRGTEAWFNGNVQKIASVTASIATRVFNDHLIRVSLEDFNDAESLMYGDFVFAAFDSRVFTIDDPFEVQNYFRWRVSDCVRNSVQMLGQANYSHKQLHNVSCGRMKEMLVAEKGIDWNECPDRHKYGAIIARVDVEKPVRFFHKKLKQWVVTEPVTRHEWQTIEGVLPPSGNEWLTPYIPVDG